jgi:hypothetical protein
MTGSQKVQIKNSPGASIRDVYYGAGPDDGDEPPDPPKVKVLFLGVNPAATSRLRLDKEIKAIEEALRASRLGERFELEQSWAAGDRELQDGLLRHQPDIVHLSGHGSGGGRVILEPEPGVREVAAAGPSADDPRIAALGRIFAAAHGRIRCVVLNACHSLATASAIAAHVGCVIGMSQAIGDSAAVRFSWSFYNALGYGASVKAAFDLASAQIVLGGLSSTGDNPRLLAPAVDPASVVFV